MWRGILSFSSKKIFEHTKRNWCSTNRSNLEREKNKKGKGNKNALSIGERKKRERSDPYRRSCWWRRRCLWRRSRARRRRRACECLWRLCCSCRRCWEAREDEPPLSRLVEKRFAASLSHPLQFPNSDFPLSHNNNFFKFVSSSPLCVSSSSFLFLVGLKQQYHTFHTPLLLYSSLNASKFLSPSTLFSAQAIWACGKK